MLIIEKRARTTTATYYRVAFQRRDRADKIYRFRCDREGRVAEAAMNGYERRIYRLCLAGQLFGPPYLEEITRSVFCRGSGLCDCGNRVALSRPINRCRGCGRRWDLGGSAIRDTLISRKLRRLA